jgi:hypothetical protein
MVSAPKTGGAREFGSSVGARSSSSASHLKNGGIDLYQFLWISVNEEISQW